MFKRWIDWLKGDAPSDPVRPPQQRRRTSAHAALQARNTPAVALRQQADIRHVGPRFEGRIENLGPGKNVLVCKDETIDDTVTPETLRLLDESPLDPSEPAGIDPYNSGQFDRSRHWDSRFRD